MMHDSGTTVPESDDEALKALTRYDESITKTLQDIYHCRRCKGEGVLLAFHNTLLTYLAVADAVFILDQPASDREAA